MIRCSKPGSKYVLPDAVSFLIVKKDPADGANRVDVDVNAVT